MHRTLTVHSSIGIVLALTLAAPSAAFAYDNRDAIRDCESRVTREYGLIDLRDTRAVQLPGEKNYKVEGNAKVDGKKYSWTCEVEDRRVVDVDYRGRRPSRTSDETPEVVPRRSGEIEVRMPGGCTVLYDRDGELLSRGRSCSSSDRRDADAAAESYFREQGYGRRDRPQEGRGEYGREGRNEYQHERGGEPPRIITGSNGAGEVVFRNECVVYYNRAGRRTEASQQCHDNQVNKADQSMRAYRREQGL